VLAGPNDLRAGLERASTLAFAGAGCGAAGAVLHINVLGVFGIILLAIGAGQLVAALLLSRQTPKAGEQPRFSPSMRPSPSSPGPRWTQFRSYFSSASPSRRCSSSRS
jgi:hypothetical protein